MGLILPSIGSWQYFAQQAYEYHQEAKFCYAIIELDKALKIAPKEIKFQLYRNRGQAYQHLLMLDEALADFERMKCRDGEELASHIYLLRSDYARGLKLNENRVIVPQPNWNPARTQKDLRGRHVELFEEGGYGDTIQMLGLIPYVEAVATSVQFKPRPALAALIGEMKSPAKPDVQVAMFDLMTIAGMREKGESILSGKPFLQFPAWASREHFGTRIGLNWRGDGSHMADPWRDIDLDALLVLVDRFPHIEFVSLQYGLTVEEKRKLWAHRVLDLGTTINNFADTAAVMAKLDGLITLCSAPAHLAGALGVTTYLLLAPRLEFRWGLKNTTPWYNSVKLIRGKEYGKWADTVDIVSAYLKG